MKFTLGIEEEYQVICPETRELISHDQRIVTEAEKLVNEQVKAEMHQAVVEVGTNICEDISEARNDLIHLRRSIAGIANDLGFKIGAAGTHPFTKWETQLITPNPRYDQIINELQDTARSNLIFGLHVHVGIPDKQLALHLTNAMRYFLPHVYALSTNSPFWEGRNTGFKSFRSKVFDKFPRTGIPGVFQTVAEYEHYLNVLIKTNCIDNPKKIWWDMCWEAGRWGAGTKGKKDREDGAGKNQRRKSEYLRRRFRWEGDWLMFGLKAAAGQRKNPGNKNVLRRVEREKIGS